MDSQLVQRRQLERNYLLEVIKCLRYLSRQGIPLQGHNNNNKFTQLLYLLGTKDKNILDHLDGKVGHKYNHHDVENELLNIMAAQVLREKLATICDHTFFSIMTDEGTDISNLEQLSFCARTVDNDLNVDEDFLGVFEIDSIKSETVVKAVKYILMRCSLNLDDCRGQTYEGASNMIGKHFGVSTKISEEQPKAIATHCQGHSLSLAVKYLTKECSILRDTNWDNWGNLRFSEVFSETRKNA